MAAIYRMEKNPPKQGEEENQVLHPRIVPNGTVTTEQLIELATDRSTFTTGDLKGAISLLSELLAFKLRDGYNVKLDGIGLFSVSLQSRPVTDKGELRSESVHFKNVNFRCDAGLKKALKTMHVSRKKESKKTSYSEAERRRRLLWYLENHTYITTNDYYRLNACTDYQARKELKQFVEDGTLQEIGTRRVKMYTLNTIIGKE